MTLYAGALKAMVLSTTTAPPQPSAAATRSARFVVTLLEAGAKRRAQLRQSQIAAQPHGELPNSSADSGTAALPA
jgi:hypothetical protein